MPTIWMTAVGEKQEDTNKKEGKDKKKSFTEEKNIKMCVFRIVDCDTTAVGN